MAAHISSSSGAPAPGSFGGGSDEDRGFERRMARLMPRVMMAAVGVLGVVWWMAAQPPAGPGWNDPNGRQAQQPPGPPQEPAPPKAESSFCSSLDCGDCATVDCGDCADCGDCLSGIDCSGIDCSCTVAGRAAVGPDRATASKTPSLRSLAGGAGGERPTCSRSPLKRFARSSGLVLPLLVLIGWRRRLRRV